MIYSYSAISSFENCPLKFKYAYIDKIEPIRRNIEAFMGNRVHEALEKLYRDKLYEKVCSLTELLNFYNERWEKEMSSLIFVAKEEYSIENYRKMGERYLIDYYNTYKPFDDGRIIALEKRVFFPLDEKHWVSGIIDRINEVNGVYEVHDYKTSLYLPTKKEIENDCQLALYALALDYLYDIKEIELVWHFLAFNKEVRLKKRSYEGVRREILKRIEKIEIAMENNEFPPKESSLCPYCEYQPICPLFRHEYMLEEMKAEEVGEEEGYKLVNEYWQVVAKIEELKAIQEDLKNKLIEYAKKNNLQCIYGAEKAITIKKSRNLYFNKKSKIEGLLKKEGLYEKYVRLDTWKLAEDIKNKVLPAHLIEKLKEFFEEKENYRIYIKSLEREE